MTETIQFWLNNKMSTGTRAAAMGDQTLVLYRDRFYVVVDGAALTKGGKSQQYSKTSLPTIWKKAMRGIIPVPSDADEIMPLTTTTSRTRVKQKKPTPPVPSPSMEEVPAAPVQPPAAQAPVQSPTAPSQPSKPPKQQRKTEPVQSVQESAVAECPYCGHRHDLILDKRKNGKPFFVSCIKCSAEFAVRFVQVTVYQAQVAGFR
ncbi:hypothetical protein [Pelotalea chapellei]|uniref:Uncharacterized protein n=1 Tax=Pelotalea chapellei TaxID=44671 RepID=A0ABS5UCY5_9BACT|nr:hypothetical protein [Pelotalea chapellei]MBT1073578.1 hypothetical protein [Pelotalea chapellei]